MAKKPKPQPFTPPASIPPLPAGIGATVEDELKRISAADVPNPFSPPDRRPFLVLRLTVPLPPGTELDEVQADTDKHLAPFGLRAIVICKDFEFVGVVPAPSAP